MRWSLHYGGKCAAFGRDDGVLWGGIEKNEQRQGREKVYIPTSQNRDVGHPRVWGGLGEQGTSANGVGAAPDKGYVDELTKEFIAESQEGLERMERCLTELEKRPDDGELVAEIFRAVHTIKGTTGFLGFGRLEKLAHAGESLLGALRDGKIAVDRGADQRAAGFDGWAAGDSAADRGDGHRGDAVEG